ncbi:thiol-disulfide isomerase/thioredoxin [Micromonospora sp. Llam0]|uniref:TlpA family protein disulfide reductase n=1 Tax=Micromonospora sp. Llam0 TaxID=2485143 RepID=UPI000F46B29B|nr:redoxin domain-containing protein [Micromonospora sp. Llam0]ROO52015.1 thiol-disulfide isomerase/thioredoxin [Micromonospora sp. Llam0]
MKVRRALLALMVVGTLVVTGCATGSDQQAATSGSSAAGAADTPTGSYDFTAATLDGGSFDGHSLAGKPALLWFWAPWCPTCLQQARPVTDLAAKYQGKVTVVGVAGLDQESAMHDFVKMAKLSGFPQLADEQGVVWKRFKMAEQSTFVVLDRTGTVVARGHTDVDKLPDVLDPLLAG